MDYIKLALVGLQIVDKLLDWGRERGQLQAGEDRAVAKASVAIAKKTETGKRLMEKIDAMPDGELGDLVDALGRE